MTRPTPIPPRRRLAERLARDLFRMNGKTGNELYLVESGYRIGWRTMADVADVIEERLKKEKL